MPLLVPIEILSYVSRPDLAVGALFANMMAGHVMLEVFGAFVVMLGGAGIIFLIPAAFSLAVNVALIGFELLVATLQATCSPSSPASTCTTQCISTNQKEH
jgi:F0F1-type ATP synthase, subunit a